MSKTCKFDLEVKRHHHIGIKNVRNISPHGDTLMYQIWKANVKLNQDVFDKHKCPVMANSKDGQGHRDNKDNKDKYLDTIRKILSQEMLICNMKAPIFIKK